MKRVLNVLKIVFIAMFIFSVPSVAFAQDTQNVNIEEKSGISIIKPWTVSFNMNLDSKTINNSNINVTDKDGKIVDVNILKGNDTKSIIVCPPTGGYMTNGTYYLNLNTNVKSKDGKNLVKPIKMKFTTSKQYEDVSKYKSLPTINNVELTNENILENKKIQFNVSSNYEGKVNYRVFLFKYPNEVYDNVNKYENVNYTEITSGYSEDVLASKSYLVNIPKGLSYGKYKILVYVKRNDKEGKYKDGNTDYDNYYSTYFKVLKNNILQDKSENETIVYKNYNVTLEKAVQAQVNRTPIFSDNGWSSPSSNLVKYYMNSNNFLCEDDKYLFLNLNYMEVDANELDNMLKGKGVLEGKGSVFLKAGKESDINPIYLISHALLETGNGTSKLAKGVLVCNVNGQAVDAKLTYNMFGIHAYDNNPIGCGSQYAYEQKWFSIDDAIIKGASFISTGYINSDKYKQNTLYKMKWNMDVTWHQYATDIGWAKKQVPRIKEFLNQCKSAKPVYEIPKFLK